MLQSNLQELIFLVEQSALTMRMTEDNPSVEAEAEAEEVAVVVAASEAVTEAASEAETEAAVLDEEVVVEAVEAVAHFTRSLAASLVSLERK